MNNSKPFQILLDSYANECSNLFEVVKSIFQYPHIQTHDDLESKLYASAFASICSDFLQIAIGMYAHEDFEAFLQEMDLLDYDFKAIQDKHPGFILEFEDQDYNEKVWNCIQYYKTIIKADLTNLFVTDAKIASFFSSIFSFNDENFSAEMSLDSIDFFSSY